MRIRGGKNGKRVAHLSANQRAAPAAAAEWTLQTGNGSATFQLITSSDALAEQLKNFIGKEISVKVDEVACVQDAGQISEAVVTKWGIG